MSHPFPAQVAVWNDVIREPFMNALESWADDFNFEKLSIKKCHAMRGTRAHQVARRASARQTRS